LPIFNRQSTDLGQSWQPHGGSGWIGKPPQKYMRLTLGLRAGIAAGAANGPFALGHHPGLARKDAF
jgi:hypothetical protein